MQAYCPKCKITKEMNDPKVIKMKNGMSTTEGNCPGCGTTISRTHKT
jgi:hypothetical protein